MSRPVLYMAHPVAPTEDEIAATPYERIERSRGEYESDIRFPLSHESRVRFAVGQNVHLAIIRLAWLRVSFSETTFIAPWIAGVQSVGSDGTPEEREAGMIDCCAVVERCDGIVLMGPRISSGMRREMEHGVANHCDPNSPDSQVFKIRPSKFEVYDLTGYQAEGDSGRNADHRTFQEWMDGYRESCTR